MSIPLVHPRRAPAAAFLPPLLAVGRLAVGRLAVGRLAVGLLAVGLLPGGAPAMHLPQAKPLAVVLAAAGLPAAALPELPKAPVGSPGFVAAAHEQGLGLAEFCAARLQLPPAKRSAADVLALAAALYSGSAEQWRDAGGTQGPGPATPASSRRSSLATVKEIDRFFIVQHRAVRKALGVEPNLAESTPVLHSLLERMQADPEYDLSDDERRLLRRERALIARVDVAGLLAAAAAVLRASDWLDADRPQLLKLPTEKPRDGVSGPVLLDRDTPYGRLVIGGAERNTYDCNRIAVVIDIGGDDHYDGAAGGADESRRFAVCIDLQGEDVYRGGSGALGSATYGLGVCIDLAGDDRYTAGVRSAGFGIAGVGVFVDAVGRDQLVIGDSGGGVGMFGVGVCVDLAGDDAQRGASGSYGVGLPGGVGLFVDVAGDDNRQLLLTGGRGYLGFGGAQGADAARPVGLGVCLDLAGDDSYTAGSQALGAGDRGGLGVCIDRAGTDTYIAKELSLGAGRRGGRGVMFDAGGRDHYFATEAIGVALDGSAGCFTDREGDDIYEVFGLGIGRAAAGGLAVFEDLAGADLFRWKPQALRAFPPPDGGQAQRPPAGRAGREPTRSGLSVFRARGPRDKFVPVTHDPAGFSTARRAELRAVGRWFVLE